MTFAVVNANIFSIIITMNIEKNNRKSIQLHSPSIESLQDKTQEEKKIELALIDEKKNKEKLPEPILKILRG